MKKKEKIGIHMLNNNHEKGPVFLIGWDSGEKFQGEEHHGKRLYSGEWVELDRFLTDIKYRELIIKIVLEDYKKYEDKCNRLH